MNGISRMFSNNKNETICIFIEYPRSANDSDDWVCKYTIEGGSFNTAGESFGVDELQAMILAIKYISTSLYFSDDYKNLDLNWLGDRDLGLIPTETTRKDIQQKMQNSG